MQEKRVTLAEIASYLDAELQGDGSRVVSEIAPLNKAGECAVSFIERTSFRKYLADTKAAAVIIAEKDVKYYAGNKLIVKNSYVSYAKLSQLFSSVPIPKPGVHDSVVIGDECEIDDSVSVAPNCVIGNRVKIGKNSIVGAGTVISDDVIIGEKCRLFPNVTIYHGARLGDRVLIHSGAVLGADGFGMANENGVWRKIYQLAGVRIGSDVEIGANSCIDRGALENTVIADGVKLDNLIQIAHNVKIGEHTAIAACTGIAGSAVIGKNCMIGGSANINGHLEITDRTVVTGTSTVVKSITEPGIYTSGFNVLPHRQWIKIISHFFHLDELAKKIDKLGERDDE